MSRGMRHRWRRFRWRRLGTASAMIGGALCLAGCEAAPIPEGEQLAVTIDPRAEAGRLDARYLGYALDTAQLTGAPWWGTGDGLEPARDPDLEAAELRQLAAQLGPATLRVGGVDCDATYFCPQAGDCEMPASYRDVYDSAERQPGVLTHESLARVASFAAEVDARILFCLNFGAGPRDPVSGEWRADNARVLMRVATSLPDGDLFDGWEAGNELNLAGSRFVMPVELTPAQYARDLVTLRELVDEEDPAARLLAPSARVTAGAELSRRFTSRVFEELAALGEAPVDLASWHLYATQSGSCDAPVVPTTADNLFAEAINDLHRSAALGMKAVVGQLPLWNTESASAECGGEAAVSDSMIDALWTADWIGLMAEAGTEAVIRHSLLGADHGLIDPETLEPRPTLVMLATFRRLVGRARLATEVDRESLKAHGFRSAASETDVVAVLANVAAESRVAVINLRGVEVESARQWNVAAGGELAGPTATLNDASVSGEGVIPEPDGIEVVIEEGIAYAEMPAYAVSFVVIEWRPDAAAAELSEED